MKRKREDVLTQFSTEDMHECSSFWFCQVHGLGLDQMGEWVRGTVDSPEVCSQGPGGQN